MTSTIEWPMAPCCYDPQNCVCCDAERALRGWYSGALRVPMTSEQKAYCLAELERAKGFDAEDYVLSEASQLAGAVLSAWLECAKDNNVAR